MIRSAAELERIIQDAITDLADQRLLRNTVALDDADAVLGEWRAERDPELAHVRDALARQHWRLTGRHPS